MAIIYSRETASGRTISGKSGEGSVYGRSFVVRTDDPTESQADIVNSCGVVFGDPHPDDGACVAKTFSCQPADDVGLIYKVSIEYSKPDLKDEDENPGAGGGPGLIPSWSASSSVTSGPVFKDVNGNKILNSAGDPLEGLEMEKAEFRLTLTQYYPTHATWRDLAKDYTNATNNAGWNGGNEAEWKCQGCSARVNIDNSDGAVLIYWEVTWEFAYRAGGWDLRPWDIGFNELDDGGAGGGGSAFGGERKRIKDKEGKPVPQPVGLCNGQAVPAGQPPCELFFQVYPRKDFGSVFGQLFTPTF